jgi:hypothetical protein
MPYGRSQYGRTPWAGFSVEAGGPQLVSEDPIAGSSTLLANGTFSFVLSSPVELDVLTLSTTLNGVTAIAGGDFVTNYGGTVDDEGTTVTVTISTHPVFVIGGTLVVVIDIKDLSGAQGSFSYTLHISPSLVETVPFTEILTTTLRAGVVAEDTYLFFEDTNFDGPKNLNATTIRVPILSGEVRYDGTTDAKNFFFTARDGGVPLEVEQATPIVDVLQSGSTASVVAGSTNDFTSVVLSLPTGAFTPTNVGDYIQLTGPSRSWNNSTVLRIVGLIDSTTLIVDEPLLTNDPLNGSITWLHTSAVRRIDLTVNKATNGKTYVASYRNLLSKEGNQKVEKDLAFVASTPRPQLSSVDFLPEGSVLVTFGEDMRADAGIMNPADYSITGASSVEVTSVVPVSDRSVLLTTNGFGSGSYLLTINASGTPHDVAGNPIDPTFNTAAFTGSIPITERSVFTDKGPIAKPPLTIQSGTTASVVSLTEITCPTGSFTSALVGLYVTLGGSTNGGTYRISAVVSTTRLRLSASFTLPDPGNGSLTWTVFDPRDGEIADDPADVTVRVNGSPVTPDAVIGLLGQVVLPSTPAPTDDVKIDYSWVLNPTVENRRLNSREFTLNGWNRDPHHVPNPSQHLYRYNTVLTKPSSYNPTNIDAVLPSPQTRDLFYRAYERAYTASLNDPNTLVLNTPNHHIAYPPLSRTVDVVNVAYTADTLPEDDPLTPWDRHGSGSATVSGGNLVITDDTTGPFPAGHPLFWTRPVDLTFPHVFAATWRMMIDTLTTPEGVWTGTAVGWSNDKKAVVVGFLLDGGVAKIGFLKKGSGNDPSQLSAWAGGFDSLGVPTGAPVVFDWTILHSYRLYRDRDGTVRLFVDGEVIESLRVTEDSLPYLEELNDPFKTLQGVFFGSLSRPGRQTSTWDFIRYVVLPTNPEQTAPSRFTSYEATVVPEDDPESWTPLGYHGTETIISPDSLLLDSTSATDETTEEEVGLVGGDFRGFVRMEPLLAASSDVVLDVNVQLRTWTHGITPNAVMASIDDGSKLVQLSFLSGTSAPKVSYPGRSLPTDATPVPWSSLGTAPVEMIGRTLRIEDASTTDGRVFFVDDSPLVTDSTRILTPTSSYMLEFRCAVVSTTPDGGGFAGVTADVFDGDAGTTGRALGVMLRRVSGVNYVALHSDGVVIQQWAFNWNDGKPHTYRLVRTQVLPTPVVSLFVDAALIGTADYTLFTASTGPATISFGSSTAASVLAQSVVDWYYVNAWKVLPSSTTKYVGFWKGHDGDSLVGYHLPTKAPLQGGSVAGNVLHDDAGDFLARGVVVGDPLVIDEGPNKGVYSIAGVPSATDVTISGTFPFAPSSVQYRIPIQTDWTASHRYRIVRDPGGSVAVFLDAVVAPLIRITYTQLDLPDSSSGLPRLVNGSTPSIMFGAFDPTNLSQTAWDYVRYGITRSPSELRIVPPHQVLNQRNIMASPEHLFTTIPHSHTDFWSSSTGIPDRSFFDNPALSAFTQLNEGTPLVPSTQTWEVRKPTPVFETVSGLNRPEDVLNDDRDFLLNDATTRVRLLVPNDVLYTSLQVVERTDGDLGLITPLTDEGEGVIQEVSFTKEVCLNYDGSVLPENDTAAPTPWVLASDNPSQVTTTALSGILTYQTGGVGTDTIYRNATPLPDQVSLQTEVKFRLKLLNDGTGGTGDTGVRYGFSANGITCAIAWVTDPFGNRLVQILDLNTSTLLAQLPFDFGDGAFHVYRFVRDPPSGVVHFYIDS